MKFQTAVLFTRVARKIWEKKRSQACLSELLFYLDLASIAITRETRKECFS